MSIEALSLSIITPFINSVSSTPSLFILTIFMLLRSTFEFSSTCFIASTIMSANFSFTLSAPFPVIAVITTCLNTSVLSLVILKLNSFRNSLALSAAILYPFVITVGCIFLSRSFSAFSRSFPASITAVVVPSPTSLS